MEGNQAPVQGAFDKAAEEFVERWVPLISPEQRLAFRREVTELKEHNAQQFQIIKGIMTRLEASSKTDDVTGLVRRKYFYQTLQQVLTVRKGADSPEAIGVVFIDMERFKQINDTLGHAVGDAALKTVAEILKEAVRTENIGSQQETELDVVARVVLRDEPEPVPAADLGPDPDISRHGGDELAVMVRLAKAEQVKKVAQRISDKINNPENQREHGFDFDGLVLTASVGAVGYTMHSDGTNVSVRQLAENIVNLADELMLKNKACRKYSPHVKLDFAITQLSDASEKGASKLVVVEEGQLS